MAADDPRGTPSPPAGRFLAPHGGSAIPVEGWGPEQEDHHHHRHRRRLPVSSSLRQMEGKRLDLDAPLLSVRRFGSSAPAPQPPSSPSACRRTAAPFYRTDLKSGPVGNPGVVPFLWEQSAGEPKAKPPAAEQANLEVGHRARGGDPDENDDDGFADALETLSRVESCFMTCSISGTAGGEIEGRAPLPGRFSEDPPGRDFVMGRFLPAAQAMASSAPQSAPKKPPSFRRPAAEPPAATSPNLRRPNYTLEQASLPHSDTGEDDDDGDDTRHLSLQGCGLLPMLCMKGSLLLGPLPGTKTRGRMPAATGRSLLLSQKQQQQQQQRRAPLRASASDAEDEHIWEEVYEHKLGRVRQKLGEEASRWTSESNQLSFWSDSPTADGSSSWRRSTGGGGAGGGAPSPMIETGDGDSIPKTGEKPSPGHRAVDSDEQLLLPDGGGKQTMDDALPAPLPPPLPESPSDSWLWRTLPTVASKGSTPLPFLGIQLGRRKQTMRASSTDSRAGNHGQGEGSPHGPGAVLVDPANGD